MSIAALPLPIQRALAYQELFELLGYDTEAVTIAFVELDAVKIPEGERALVTWLEPDDDEHADQENNFVCFCGSVPTAWVSEERWSAEVAPVWDGLTAKERGDHRRRLLPLEEVTQLVHALIAQDLPPPRLAEELPDLFGENVLN